MDNNQNQQQPNNMNNQQIPNYQNNPYPQQPMNGPMMNNQIMGQSQPVQYNQNIEGPTSQPVLNNQNFSQPSIVQYNQNTSNGIEQPTMNNQTIEQNQNTFNNQPQPIPEPSSVEPPKVDSNTQDDDFKEPKKSKAGLIFFLLFLILILGGGAYYYFIYTSPQNIFKAAIDTTLSGVKGILNEEYKTPKDYTYSFNIKTEDEEYKTITDIINNISVSGSKYVSGDTTKSKTIATYKGKTIIDITSLVSTKNNEASYLNIANIFDKTIKIEIPEETKEELNTLKINNIKVIYTSIENAIKKALENATYVKKISNVEDTFATISILQIDKRFQEDFYNTLLQDNEYIKAISELNSESEESVKEDLTSTISDIEDTNVKLTIYSSLLTNKLIKFTCESTNSNLSITKDNNKYTYEISENNTLKLKGTLETIQSNNENNINLSINIIEEELALEIKLTNKPSSVSDIEIDTTNVVSIEELTDDEMMEIINNIENNEGINLLLEDLESILSE